MHLKMSHKVLLGVFGGQTVDAQEEKTGVIPQTMANAAIIDTGVGSAVGHLVIENLTANNSGVAAVFNTSGVATIAGFNGATGVTVAKDTASSLNVYVESGTIRIQNLTGGEIRARVQIV